MPEDQAPYDYGNGLGAQRSVEEEMDERIMGRMPAFDDGQLRALALEHAVATRGPDDDKHGEQVINRADRFLGFLKGEATRPA